MDRIQSELHRLRVALLDQNHPRFAEFWAAQQALAWASDPDSFASPSAAIRGSEEARAGC